MPGSIFAMPIEISIRGNVVSLVSKGASSAQDIIQQLIELYQSPDFPPEPVMFWDLRDSQSFGGHSGRDMGMIADKTSSFTKGSKFSSIFLVPDDLYHGMVRMAAAYGGAAGDDIHIFRSEAQAMALLRELEK